MDGASTKVCSYIWLLRSFYMDVFVVVRYYIDPPSIVIIGKPSTALVTQLEVDEKSRIAQQIAELGPEGLKKAEADVEAAKTEHDKPIPQELVTAFPVPDVKSISWIAVQSIQEPGKGRKGKMPSTTSSELARHIGVDGSPDPLSFFVQYDHVEVSISLPYRYFP